MILIKFIWLTNFNLIKIYIYLSICYQFGILLYDTLSQAYAVGFNVNNFFKLTNFVCSDV